jgi:hypothetical protein
MIAGKDKTLDIARLAEPAYFAERLAIYQADPLRWAWYVRVHVHRCMQCAREVSHTGLEAERDGLAAHLCCGRDVRQAPP